MRRQPERGVQNAGESVTREAGADADRLRRALGDVATAEDHRVGPDADPPQHPVPGPSDEPSDAAIAHEVIDGYLTARAEHWRQLAVASREPDCRTSSHAAQDRLTRWRETGRIDNWVANHVADAARDNAAREHQEAVAAGAGPQVSDAAARRVHAVRRWLRSQGHQLADDVVEGG